MRRGLHKIVLAAFVVALAAGAWTAHAMSPRGPAPWPSRTVTFFNASGWRHVVPTAAALWNAADAGVRLEAVGRRSKADVVVVSRSAQAIQRGCPPSGGVKDCLAYATIGYRAHGGQLVLPYPEGDDAHPTRIEVRMIVHEFGHVLGLQHQRGCTVMDHDLYAPRCVTVSADAPRGPGLAGLAAEDVGPTGQDIAALRDLYGRR